MRNDKTVCGFIIGEAQIKIAIFVCVTLHCYFNVVETISFMEERNGLCATFVYMQAKLGHLMCPIEP